MRWEAQNLLVGGKGGWGGGRSNYDHVFTELTADAEKIQLQPGGRIPPVQPAVQIKAEMSKCVSTFYLNRLKTDT